MYAIQLNNENTTTAFYTGMSNFAIEYNFINLHP